MNNKRLSSKARDKKRIQRLRRIVLPVLALIVILALVLFKKCYLERPGTIDRGDKVLHGPYKVEKVVDGDTFYIKMDGKSEKVRLIGIDAPESVAPSYSGKENTDEGKKASEYLEKLIKGKTVYLEYDLDTYDQYGRLLAYVYLSDEETMVQEKILSEGYAQVMTVQPNVKYAEEFLKLQRKAREESRGFWGSSWK
ncbi:MAG: thermonuclease family protein [Firmicutes bacterium]|nr:thermonuclease family protein [Bacillota bacterium]